MRTSTLLTFLSVASAEQIVAEERPRLLPGLLSILGNSADALQAPAVRAPRLRAGRPAMQFGFQNFDRDAVERDGLQILSPIAGAAKRDPDQELKKFKKKEDAVATGTLPAVAVLGAPLGGGLAIIAAALIADPNLVPSSTPFAFLNRFYPPAVEKKARDTATREKLEKAAAEKKAKEEAKKAEKEAAAKAEAEAKAKEEAAAAAAKPKAKAR